MWFRYYLAEHIVAAMGELESREGVLQLDRGITCIGKVSSHEDFAHSSDALPHADGTCGVRVTCTEDAADCLHILTLS
jgi:hypothetical protein